MRRYDIVKIKENGILKLPEDFAYDIGLVKGSYFLVEINPQIKEANIERIALPGKNLYELEITAEDKPGVLSRIHGILGRYRVNIAFSEGEEIKGTNTSAIVSVIDVSKMKISPEDLESHIGKLKEVKEVFLKRID
ncbi:MAG: ACT domain-containing protein [Thermoplasmata archaeon]